jgi:hypothetical protein
MRAPAISPDSAALFLALLDFSESRSPGAACAFLRGYCVARSHEPVDPRSEPPEPSNGVAVARVQLTRG